MIARLLLFLALVVSGLVIALSLRVPGPPPTADHISSAPTFTEGLREHLQDVQAAADALVELGETRERNLLVVRQRQSAMNAALDATDAWLAQHNEHEDDIAVVAYRSGAALIRKSMSEAQSAFFRFDWDGIAAANVTLQDGAHLITEAISHLAPTR
jgi:hypothetical protein